MREWEELILSHIKNMLFYLVFLNVNIYIFNTTIVMIDDKKIEAAAINKCGFISSEFYSGAKWMQEEFLKNLWHPASEKPNIKQGECCVTCLVKFKNGSTELCVYFRNPEGWVCDDMSPKDFKRNFKGWLYIDNLFPKKGGNQ